jgi:hypothetical protein
MEPMHANHEKNPSFRGHSRPHREWDPESVWLYLQTDSGPRASRSPGMTKR